MNPLLLDLRTLPPEGHRISGKLPPEFFDLPQGDIVQPDSPLAYDLLLVPDGDSLNISGSLDATFLLQCGRCLERFPHRVHLEEYLNEATLENDSTIDLTDLVREDILLALPNYPRCEDGNIDPRDCPAEGSFESDDTEDVDELPGAERGVWNVLDQLK